MTSSETSNPYMTMPLSRVRNDAIDGVTLARRAWRARDPEGAARELGRIVEPHDVRRVTDTKGQGPSKGLGRAFTPSPAADAAQARQQRVVSAVGDYLHGHAPGHKADGRVGNANNRTATMKREET